MAESDFFLLSRADRDRLRKMRRAIDAMNQNIVGGKRFSGQRPAHNSFDAWYPFYNDSGETIPGHAIMRVTDTTDAGEETGQAPGSGNPILWCQQAGTEFGEHYVVNGPMPVEEGQFGQCLTRGPCLILYDETSGTPANRQGWGPKPGSWKLHKGYPCTTYCLDIHSSSDKSLVGSVQLINTLLCKATAFLADGPVSSNYQIWKGTIASGANSGFSTLPSIELVQDIPSGKFFLARWVNNGWVGRGLGGGTTIYKCKLNGALAATDANATIDNVTSLSGEAAPSPTSAVNTLDLAGADNDDCYIVENTNGASATYELLNVMHHDCEA